MREKGNVKEKIIFYKDYKITVSYHPSRRSGVVYATYLKPQPEEIHFDRNGKGAFSNQSVQYVVSRAKKWVDRKEDNERRILKSAIDEMRMIEEMKIASARQ